MKVVVKYGMSPSASIELLADSSILPTGRPLFVPDWATSFTATLSIAARINRLGKCIAPKFAHRYWDALTGCLLTHGIDNHGEAISHQALSRSHDGALLLGEMVSKDKMSLDENTLQCLVDDIPTAHASLTGLSRLIDDTISQVSQYMTFKMGDLLCISCESALPLGINTTTELTLNGQKVLKTKIK